MKIGSSLKINKIKIGNQFLKEQNLNLLSLKGDKGFRCMWCNFVSNFTGNIVDELTFKKDVNLKREVNSSIGTWLGQKWITN